MPNIVQVCDYLNNLIYFILYEDFSQLFTWNLRYIIVLYIENNLYQSIMPSINKDPQRVFLKQQILSIGWQWVIMKATVDPNYRVATIIEFILWNQLSNIHIFG